MSNSSLEYFCVMSTWYYVSVWFHIVAGAFWIGGMLFLPLVLLPGIKNHPDRKSLLMATGLKFRFYGYVMLFLLLLTGLLNINFRGIPFSWKFFTENHWGKLASTKIILFILMLVISTMHDLLAGRKAVSSMGDNRKIRLIASWSGRLLLLISLAMAYIGVLLSRGG